MHDIWNPWHGCTKYSEGCRYCYMYYMDSLNDHDGSRIYHTKGSAGDPLAKDRSGAWRICSGEKIRVCMTSDFFLEEADEWREDVWNAIKNRPDVFFILVTKRIPRVKECLPKDWGDGWDNVLLYATCENQAAADERIPILLELPFKHKGIMCAPFIGEVDLGNTLETGQIEIVFAGGENYGGTRPCHFDWIKKLRAKCEAANVSFCFAETGTFFVKDGRTYHIPSKKVQAQMAFKSGMSFQGKPMEITLRDQLGLVLEEADLYQPRYDGPICHQCSNRMLCNGCSHCSRCTMK